MELSTLLIVVVTAAIILYVLFKKRIDWVSDGKAEVYENMQFSTQEFYSRTSELIKAKEYPDVVLSRVEHKVGGILSAKREYLRIEYKEYFFDICAAPFANDFFVSWRQGILRQIGVTRKRLKSFYEQDTESMFKLAIRQCLYQAMHEFAEEKGVRTNGQDKALPLYN